MAGTGKHAEVPRQPGNSGCYNCMKRRIKCDREHPSCNKCLRKGLECPGYGVRYRFQTSVRDGQQPGGCHTSSVDDPKELTPQALLWPDGSWTSTQPSSLTSTGPGRGERTISLQDRPLEGRQPVPDIWSQDSASESAIFSIPRHLDLIDGSTRGLFDQFSTTIAPYMVVVDSSSFNGYRSLLLPLAATDELVRAAVCVASLDFLAYQQPAMRRQAELGFQSILKQLRYRTSAHTDLVDLSAWATILILLTAETVTGGTNLPYLFRILQHLANANTSDGCTSVMHAFLAEQTRMMTFFAQPLLQEEPHTLWSSCLSEGSLDFVSNIAIFRPDLSKELDLCKAAIRIACSIYVTRATLNPPHGDTFEALEKLKALCQFMQPSTPGHHALVWVSFIAAAESSTLKHRQFFTTRLQEVYLRTRFRNIPTALTALHEIWKVQTVRRWTEMLPDGMPVFII